MYERALYVQMITLNHFTYLMCDLQPLRRSFTVYGEDEYKGPTFVQYTGTNWEWYTDLPSLFIYKPLVTITDCIN